MGIKDVKLKKGMSREEVNKLIGEWIELEDKVYLGTEYKYNWKCKCGNIIYDNTFINLKSRKFLCCDKCKYKMLKMKHKQEVEKDGEYEYINSYFKDDRLPGGEVNDKVRIEVKHMYCENSYIVRYDAFKSYKCPKCCNSYENSFVYHIEEELGLKLEDVWDFEKNTLSPYHIWKSGTEYVWIKCQNKKYHDSYKVKIANYYNGTRCPYCAKNISISKKEDSFAQYHIENTKNFFESYWDWIRNKVNPYYLSPSNKKKIWVKCQNEDINKLNGIKKKDYHKSYQISCFNFTSGCRCSYCASSKIHPYDSFGYHHFDKVMSWHPDNKISPFRVALNSHKKYKFICPKCGKIVDRSLANANKQGCKCKKCSMSNGEDRISKWLESNNIFYKYEKEFNGLIGLGGGNLSYDFYLPEYNLLIEYQGDQHDRYVKGFHKSYVDFEKQQEHDRRKREYAMRHDIKLLEIWEESSDNIEEILKGEIIYKNKLI